MTNSVQSENDVVKKIFIWMNLWYAYQQLKLNLVLSGLSISHYSSTPKQEKG